MVVSWVIGVPPNHPFLDGIFPYKNHPVIGDPPWLWNPPYVFWLDPPGMMFILMFSVGHNLQRRSERTAHRFRPRYPGHVLILWKMEPKINGLVEGKNMETSGRTTPDEFLVVSCGFSRWNHQSIRIPPNIAPPPKSPGVGQALHSLCCNLSAWVFSEG